MGIKEWKITPEQPARVILIDEAGQLFRKNVAAKVKNRVIGAIDTLTYQSRKCGYVVVACTQHSQLGSDPDPARVDVRCGASDEDAAWL